MAKSLTAEEVLIYLYASKKGIWEDIYKSICSKEPLPDDLDKCREVINTFVRDHSGSIITMIDEKFPTILKARKHPPFVLVYSGNLDILNETQIICLENDTLSGVLTKHNLSHAFLDNDNYCHIRHPYIKPSTGEQIYDEVVIDDDKIHSMFTMETICKKAVAIDGQDNFVEEMGKTFDLKKLYALPGNAGCACNQLIKRGWQLCDSWQDLVFDE